MDASPPSELHLPVLLDETLAALAPHDGGRYLDCTVGLGGHAERILALSAPTGRLLGLDRDADALAHAGRRLERFGDRVELVHASYVDAEAIAAARSFAPLDGMLLDLGVSSLQVDTAGRGFSFRRDGPLDMRYDPTSDEPTAADLVNGASEAELGAIIHDYGEEPAARRIARAIVRERPVRSTLQLAKLVERVAGRPGQRLSPATRTFQALRIAVNRELDGLTTVLEAAIGLLAAGGRLAVISFHSLEDRLVKQFLQRESKDCLCPPDLPVCCCGHQRRFAPLARGAITPSEAEIERNPRSRSAKLRAAVRL